MASNELPWYYQANVLRVVDGDTVEVECDLGFGIYSRHTVRLAGINCPELTTDAGKAAKLYTANWLNANSAVAKPWAVILKTLKGNETEKYGRYLAYVYTDLAGTKCLNTDLVTSGNAVIYNP